MKIGVVQLNAGDDPAANLITTCDYLSQAVAAGAEFICMPEVTNCVSADRQHQNNVLQHQHDDETLIAIQQFARENSVWVNIGSLALKSDTDDGRFVNRSFMIDALGNIAAVYDKIHMFDVTLSETESYKESAGFVPGDRAVLCETPFATCGMSICYDLRFPQLHRTLAKSGAKILTIPAAFAVPTGQAHWEVLLRSRAIETGCFVIAAAQTGTHPTQAGRPRKTYGHSMVIDPWGRVLLDAGTDAGVSIVDFDLKEVAQARQRIPALTHDVAFKGPE